MAKVTQLRVTPVIVSGLVGLAGGFFLCSKLMDTPKDMKKWTVDGACAAEFGPEARFRGYTNAPNDMNLVQLTADLKGRTCYAEFADGLGGVATFSWPANRWQLDKNGKYIPASAVAAASGPTP